MPDTATSPLDQVLSSVVGCLTPEVAQRIAELRPDVGVQSRIEELADKANEGDLTAAERAEYQQFVEVLDFLTLLQIKARKMAMTAKGA